MRSHKQRHKSEQLRTQAAHLWVLPRLPQQRHAVLVVAQRARRVALGAAAVSQAAADGTQPERETRGAAEDIHWPVALANGLLRLLHLPLHQCSLHASAKRVPTPAGAKSSCSGQPQGRGKHCRPCIVPALQWRQLSGCGLCSHRSVQLLLQVLAAHLEAVAGAVCRLERAEGGSAVWRGAVGCAGKARRMHTNGVVCEQQPAGRGPAQHNRISPPTKPEARCSSTHPCCRRRWPVGPVAAGRRRGSAPQPCRPPGREGWRGATVMRQPVGHRRECTRHAVHWRDRRFDRGGKPGDAARCTEAAPQKVCMQQLDDHAT